MLLISSEEQRFLKTIIGPEEKRRRDREVTQKVRREAGMMTREQYILETQKRRLEAIKMRDKSLTCKEIATHMGTTVSAVNWLLNGANW